MKSNFKFFKNSKSLPVDKFFQNVLYDEKFGYYNSKVPFGAKGDFVTAPSISNLFSEMIAVWIISTWEILNKPKNINVIELGSGDGRLIEIMLKVFSRFPKFNKAKKIYSLEKSKYLKKIQKKKFKKKEVKWINDVKEIEGGPVIFFGNEFFDAIPIKQFKRVNDTLYEKHFTLENNFKIKEIFKKASSHDSKNINSFKILKNLKFIEYPKNGLRELEKIIKKIYAQDGCLLLIDYGYLKPHNENTLQSLINHKKNNITNNLGQADVTSHVNFSLLKEFFLKKDLTVKEVISQREFLENMGIKKRAEIIAKKMRFSEQSNLYFRLKRLISPNLMGDLFKVIFVHKFKSKNYSGFK